ncbi:MAG: hypothetical protein JSV66_13220 [Trueperaceae bacterium]|nr:MAG: hypothetical protein JSV66_13220 [Trueperaceae bacterium]
MSRPLTEQHSGTYRLLYWAPRVLGLLVTIFMSLLAVDVFNEGYGRWEAMLALLIHLVPAATLLVVLAFSWYKERSGGIGFILLGALALLVFRQNDDWIAYLVIAGPAVLTGALFLLSWRFCRRTEPAPSA